MLTREQILSFDDRKPVEVAVPEWGGSVYVRTMSGAELWEFQSKHSGKPAENTDVLCGLIAASVCDAAGVLIFKPEDVPALRQRNAIALQRLWDAVRKANPITAADVESAEKN